MIAKMAQLWKRMGSVLPSIMLVHFTHHICTGILVPLLPLIRDYFALSYSQSGLLLSAYTLTYGFSQLFMGGIADRVNKRLLITFGLWGLAFSTMAIGVSNSYYQVLALLVLVGLFGGTYHPSAPALLAQHFSKGRRGTVFGLHLVGGSSSFLVTPVLAGLVVRVAEWRQAFLVLAIPAIFAGLLFLSLARAGEARAREVEAEDKDPTLGIAGAARLLGLVIAIATLSQLVSVGATNFLPIYLVDKHSVAPANAAMLVGLVFGAGIVGAPLGGFFSDRIGRKMVIMISVAATGPLLYLLTILPFGFWLLATFVILGMAIVAKAPALQSLIVDTLPVNQRGTALGIFFFLTGEVNGLLAPVIGYLMDTLGLNQTFTLLALVAIAASALVLLIRKRI